ncbi:MAG: hypothetical protein DRJ59_06930 [Thermoprotei archaeon]|nr:MAG: hypothetical protein DRJ59_06930 [Thermoprotei archaeon]
MKLNWKEIKKLCIIRLKHLLNLLEKYGYSCKLTINDIEIWFSAPTFYPNIIPDVELDALLLHEIIELCEIKKMKIPLTHDIFIKYSNEVELAHAISLRIQLPIAMDFKWKKFIRTYAKLIREYLNEDLPEHIRNTYRKILNEYQEALKLIS